jgi:hypothetical protein
MISVSRFFSYFTIFLFALLQPFITNGQNIFPERFTVGVNAQNKALQVGGLKLFTQQSIGQSGIIGTSTNGTITLMQGFLHPPIYGQKNKVPLVNSFKLNIIISPNPFSHSLTISIFDNIEHNIDISIISLLGKIVYQEIFSKSQEISIAPTSLQSGLYIIKVSSGNKTYSGKIVKE